MIRTPGIGRRNAGRHILHFAASRFLDEGVASAESFDPPSSQTTTWSPDRTKYVAFPSTLPGRRGPPELGFLPPSLFRGPITVIPRPEFPALTTEIPVSVGRNADDRESTFGHRVVSGCQSF